MWTPETLYEHYQVRITALEKAFDSRIGDIHRAVEIALAAQQRAIDLALASTNRELKASLDAIDDRILKLNKLRSAVEEDRDVLVRKTELRPELDAMQADSRAIRQAITTLEARVNTIQGERQGGPKALSYASLIISLIVAIIGIYLMVTGSGG